MKIYKTLAFIIMALPLSQILAQNDSSTYNESVIVVGDYKAVLDKSFKINVAPVITDTTETLQHDFSYNITPQRLTAIFSPARLAYVKITEPPQRLYNNYIRLGMGNYWTPMADIYYHSTRNKNLAYGARLYHLSSWGKIGSKIDSIASPDYYGPNHFATTDLSLFGKYILKDNIQLSTDIDFNRDYSMFYGFSDSTLRATMRSPRDSISLNQYGMAYNNFMWRVGAKNLNTDVNKLGYDANVGINSLGARYGMNEFTLNVDGTVHYGFPMFQKSKGIAYFRFDWDGFKSNYSPEYNTDGTLYLPLGHVATTADTFAATRNVVIANPYIDFIFHRFQVHAGITTSWDGFTNSDTADFYFFPDVMMSTTLFNDAMNISFGVTSNVKANSWNDIRLINPYVEPNAEERATKEHNVFCRVRFTFSKKLELNAQAAINQYDDALMFRPDHTKYSLHNVFAATYVDYSQATIGANLTFVNDEMINMQIGGNLYHNFVKGESQPPILYSPNFDAHLTANVNYKDKVLVHLQGLLLGKEFADYELVNPGVTLANPVERVCDTLPMRFGVNVEVEYIHTRALSFFAKFDNILCQRYFYWANYPSQRINVMLGLTYTIPTKRH